MEQFDANRSNPSLRHYDIAIVGAGLVGLATARELLIRQPRLRVVVLEKEPALARQQSGHNSGVIHSGIYYTPGSLKAKTCVAGHRAMLEFCHDHGIPFDICGKVIVALNESEIPRLENLYRRGIANGVQDLELIGQERLHELEPYATGIKAIYSPQTGITDFVKVAQAYAQRDSTVRRRNNYQLQSHISVYIKVGRPCFFAYNPIQIIGTCISKYKPAMSSPVEDSSPISSVK